MRRKESNWRHKLFAFLGSCAAVFLVLVLGEVFCRTFLDINLRKTSAEFVRLSEDGIVVANNPNSSGVSFGVPVFSDSNGFRVPENFSHRRDAKAILLIGDSVTFGVGVPEEETFAGLMRKSIIDREVYNSGVIGFSIPDYARFVREFVPDHPEISEAYLFFCLNDFHTSEVYQKKDHDPGPWGSIKRVITNAFVWINEFFGPRSKLYVLITGLTIDPSSQYYRGDRNNMEVDDERFEEVMRPIVEIEQKFQDRGVELTVVLSPYEMQVRSNASTDFSPQDRVREYLAINGVRSIDTRDKFMRIEHPSEAFLFADPMHLSAKGHRLVYETIIDDRRARYEPLP